MKYTRENREEYFEELTRRARNLLAIHNMCEAAKLLVEGGATPEHAFLAVNAAAILESEVVIP